MKTQNNKILALASALVALLFNLSVLQPANADSSVPKPPGLYGGYTTTLLPNGKWLVAGGEKGNGGNADCEKARLYDPITGTWTNTGSMTGKRMYHAAALLSNGKVLVVGGESGGDNSQLSSAEIYDPATGTWTRTGSLNVARQGGHTATLLSDGKVLVAGGATRNGRTVYLSSAELYDPATERWTMTGPMNVIRHGHTATLLTNGSVLVAGGWDENANWLFSAELYDPSTGKWTMTGTMAYESRFFYTSTLLTNGQVLLTTSDPNAWIASKELYDPATGQWKAIGPRKPHFVSSRNLDRTLTISPQSGSSFLASEEIELMVESADRFGVTNIQLFRDTVEIGEGEESPFRYAITNMASGTYTFFAKAAFANGLASTSAPISISFKSSEPQVSLAPGPTEFISETHVKTSPAILLASVVGVNPNALTKVTLNGASQPLQTGNFVLHPPLTEGKNVFVLVATDNQGRTGKATTEVDLDSTAPTVSIIEPVNGALINALCVDVHGTFTAKNLKEITIQNPSANMGVPALVSGKTFEARNVFLGPGTNTILAVAEDMAKNMGTNTITVMGPTDTNIAQTLPVQVQITPSGGFAPLAVTFNVQAHVPGKIQKVFYDFNGDNVPDQISSDLQPVAYTYKAGGEYFPVVTIQTSIGRFSSLSGMMGMFAAAFGGSGPSFVNVQMPPVLLSTIKITDPVDVKWTATSNLYVLSGSTATITEFDANGKIIRLKTGFGSNPSGLAVDAAGNVYVAVTGNNQVWKFKPTANSFEADMSFGISGFIGNKDGSAGAGSNQFNAPFDVAVTPDGSQISVSDSTNNRIQQFSAANGSFIASFGSQGSDIGQFNTPKGLTYDSSGILYIADSGNNRIVLAQFTAVIGATGTGGADLGQFITNDPKGKQLPGYLAQLAGHLAGEQTDALDKLDRLQKNIANLAVQGRCKIIRADVFSWFASAPEPPRRADLLFLDPPYAFLTDRAGDLTTLAAQIAAKHLSPKGLVVFRHDVGESLDLPALVPVDIRDYGSMRVQFLKNAGS